MVTKGPRGARRVQPAVHEQLEIEQEALSVVLAQHWRAAKESFENLMDWRRGNLLATLVVAIALSLPSLFLVLIQNALDWSNDFQTGGHLSLYLSPALESSRATELADELVANSQIESVQLITSEQALEEFRAHSGLTNVLQGLEKNPLPAVILVTPAPGYTSALQLGLLRTQLQALDEVDVADHDREWLERLEHLLALGKRLAYVLAVFFAAAVVLIVGGVIRGLVVSHREEILVLKLFGATDSFVRRPLLYAGFWSGLMGALLAAALTQSALLYMGPGVSQLAATYDYPLALRGLNVVELLTLILAGTGLGVLGAFVSVAGQLRKMDPGKEEHPAV